MLEWLQRRAVKVLRGLEGLRENELRELGLLENRRLWVDFTACFHYI